MYIFVFEKFLHITFITIYTIYLGSSSVLHALQKEMHLFKVYSAFHCCPFLNPSSSLYLHYFINTLNLEMYLLLNFCTVCLHCMSESRSPLVKHLLCVLFCTLLPPPQPMLFLSPQKVMSYNRDTSIMLCYGVHMSLHAKGYNLYYCPLLIKIFFIFGAT